MLPHSLCRRCRIVVNVQLIARRLGRSPIIWNREVTVSFLRDAE